MTYYEGAEPIPQRPITLEPWAWRESGHWLAYLYEWRNMIYANPKVGLTGIEKWDGWK